MKFGNLFPMFSKTPVLEVLSEVTNLDEQKLILSNIIEIALLSHPSFDESNPDILSSELKMYKHELSLKKDWLFMRKDNKILIAASLDEMKEKKGVFVIDDLVKLNHKNIDTIDLSEYRLLIVDFFDALIKFAKKSTNINWLIYYTSNNYSIRPAVRAGFNANALRDPNLMACIYKVIKKIRKNNFLGKILLYENHIPKDNQFDEIFKEEALIDARKTSQRLNTTFSKKLSNTDIESARKALGENIHFIDSHSSDLAYKGLILSCRTS